MSQASTTATTTNTTNNVPGDPMSIQTTLLTTGASLVQNFAPVKQVCAHLNAFHVYASDPTRSVEANHYCSHLNEDVRQCLLYDSADANARLIGVEYMVSPKVFETLPDDEKRLWHSHVYEVKSGMLIMPKPNTVPDLLWEKAETKEMETVIGWYGKIYHLWQVDRGDKLPLGEPQLMVSFTDDSQVPMEKLKERNERYHIDQKHKAEIRKHLVDPEIHPAADKIWKKKEL